MEKSDGRLSVFSMGKWSRVSSRSSTSPICRYIYHGGTRKLTLVSREERWASDGIQVGGIDSSRGVVGTWFDKDFDVHGPAGPTAFWKVCDSTTDNKTEFDGEEEEFGLY